MLWRIVGEEIAEDRTLLLSGLCLYGAALEASRLGADRLGINPQKVELHAVLLDLMVEGPKGEQHPELARHPRWAERRGA